MMGNTIHHHQQHQQQQQQQSKHRKGVKKRDGDPYGNHKQNKTI